MANGGGNIGGIGLGGVLVILGILLALFWSVWVGVIIALVGLIAFGGFARGRWYYSRSSAAPPRAFRGRQPTSLRAGRSSPWRRESRSRRLP